MLLDIESCMVVKNSPAVLSSMMRFKKPLKREFDIDTLLIYDDDADVSALCKSIKMLTDIGTSVLALKKVPDMKYRQLLKFNGKGVELIENNG